VKSETRARDFCTSLNAVDFCFRRHIRGAEIILTFSEPRYNVHLDVFPSKKGAGQTAQPERRQEAKPRGPRETQRRCKR
jgi:hypothetical protein